MNYLLKSPLLVLTLCLMTLWLSELIGASFRKRRNLLEDERDGFSHIAAATLTLLGRIVAGLRVARPLTPVAARFANKRRSAHCRNHLSIANNPWRAESTA
jgi:hypothetical protein